MALNVMLDLAPLYSVTPHPIVRGRSYDFKRRIRGFTRTERPARYYYIDFSIFRRYAPDDDAPLEDIIVGGDKSVPEFEGTDEAQDPLWTVIYYLGDLIRTGFLEVRFPSQYPTALTALHSQAARGFEFMEPLIADMVQQDPSKRLTIREVHSRFEELLSSLSKRKLRSRVMYRGELAIVGAFRSLRCYFRTSIRVLRGTPVLPTP